MTQEERLGAAQKGQCVLHEVVARRFQTEAQRNASGRPLPAFIEQETRALAVAHNALEDGLVGYMQLLEERYQLVAERPQLLAESTALYSTIDLLDRYGLLRPITGPTAKLIDAVTRSIDLIKTHRHHIQLPILTGGYHAQD